MITPGPAQGQTPSAGRDRRHRALNGSARERRIASGSRLPTISERCAICARRAQLPDAGTELEIVVVRCDVRADQARDPVVMARGASADTGILRLVEEPERSQEMFSDESDNDEEAGPQKSFRITAEGTAELDTWCGSRHERSFGHMVIQFAQAKEQAPLVGRRSLAVRKVANDSLPRIAVRAGRSYPVGPGARSNS